MEGEVSRISRENYFADWPYHHLAVRYDEVVTALALHEMEHGYLYAVSPWGFHYGVRKDLSHHGALQSLCSDDPWHWPDEQRDLWYWDPTNIIYGSVMHTLMRNLASSSLHEPCGKLRDAIDVCNDETLGDHVEAVLGLEYILRYDRPRPDEFLGCTHHMYSLEALVEYRELIDEACRLCIALRLHLELPWESRAFAERVFWNGVVPSL